MTKWNKEYYKKYKKEWNIKNKKEINKDIKERRRNPKYKKKQQEWNKKWQNKNIDKVKFYRRKSQRKRDLNIKNNIGNHSFEQWQELKKKYAYCCASCGMQEPFIKQWFIKLTEDHIIPLSKGGSNNIDNIQPLCIGCNSKKGATCWKNL